MGKKGLCGLCVRNKDCTFPRQFPVVQCEEFIGYEPIAVELKEEKQKKMNFDEEPAVWE